MFKLIMVNNIPQGLIISCQAPVESPLHHPFVIAAMAEASCNQGAVGIRIDTPDHILAVREKITVPIIGLWKQKIPDYDIYITPKFEYAKAVIDAGADIIAIDATLRKRPEDLAELMDKIHKLGKLVMADIDTIEAAIAAEKLGADVIGTTLYGYTPATANLSPPGFDLLAEMVQKLKVPCICEGGINSAEMAKKALEIGAYSVVVGTAITGIDLQVKSYVNCIYK